MAAKSVEERLQRIEDFQQIQNIMGRYAYHVMAGMTKEIGEQMFSNRPDTRVYLGEQGYIEGPKAFLKVEAMRPAVSEQERQERRVGTMAMHCPICPVIEVARDGKTAKGVWIGLGLLAMKNRETGEPTGTWEWDKYGVDFIKENGQWKIWHHHIYRLLHGWGVDEKWADQFKKPEPFLGMKMDGPPVDDNPYRPDSVQRLVPKPPEPYETWADTTMY
jgi:hypothetical protein